MSDFKLAVGVSGSGTLADAMLAAGLPIGLVIADRPCMAISEVAPRYGVEARIVDREEFGFDLADIGRFDRSGFSRAVLRALRNSGVDGFVSAGFGTVLSEAFFDGCQDGNGRLWGYRGAALNSHPALLPAYKGEPHAVRCAVRDGVELTGTTIHVQTADVDGEPYIVQAEVPVLPDDDEASLHERIKVKERELYVMVLQMWVNFHSADPTFCWPTKQ